MQLFQACKFNPPSLGFATSCKKYDPGNRANSNVERAGIFRDISKSVVASRTISPIFRSLAGNSCGSETSTSHILAGQDGAEAHPSTMRLSSLLPSQSFSCPKCAKYCLGVIQIERKMTCATGDMKALSSRRCHTFPLSRNLTSSGRIEMAASSAFRPLNLTS